MRCIRITAKNTLFKTTGHPCLLIICILTGEVILHAALRPIYWFSDVSLLFMYLFPSVYVFGKMSIQDALHIVITFPFTEQVFWVPYKCWAWQFVRYMIFSLPKLSFCSWLSLAKTNVKEFTIYFFYWILWLQFLHQVFNPV